MLYFKTLSAVVEYAELNDTSKDHIQAVCPWGELFLYQNYIYTSPFDMKGGFFYRKEYVWYLHNDYIECQLFFVAKGIAELIRVPDDYLYQTIYKSENGWIYEHSIEPLDVKTDMFYRKLLDQTKGESVWSRWES